MKTQAPPPPLPVTAPDFSVPYAPAPASVRTMLYQMAELLLRYPNEEERLLAPEALDNSFLTEAPDLATVVEWLMFLGEDEITEDDLRTMYQLRGHLRPRG